MTRIVKRAKSQWLGVTCAALYVLVPAIWLLALVAPSDETVRIRSSLAFDLGVPSDFNWDPSAIPSTFLTNNGPTPPLFQRVASEAVAAQDTPHDELSVALSIARELMTAPKRLESPIRADITTSYNAIKNDGRGYCADFAKVFNGIAIAAKLPVRQWGIAFDAFGSGHTFNEIYDRSRSKWVLVDSFHSLYFVDAVTREPLSVLDVHDRLLTLDSAQRGVAIERIVPARFPFRSDALALDYYRRGMSQLYLVWGTNVFDYERSLAYRLTSPFSRALEELAAIVVGNYPRMHVYPTGVSDRDVNELRQRRTQLALAVVSVLLAACLLVLQIYQFLRHTPQHRD